MSIVYTDGLALDIPEGLPTPTVRGEKFRKRLENANRIRFSVIMNYDSGKMKTTRTRNAPGICADNETTGYPSPWFQLSHEEIDALMPLYIAFEQFDMDAMNLIDKANGISGRAEKMAEGIGGVKDDATIRDLRYEQDTSRSDVVSEVINMRKDAAEIKQKAMDSRDAADLYKRPSTVLTEDFASRQHYDKEEAAGRFGFLQRYAHKRRDERDLAVIEKRETALMETEMIKVRAAERATIEHEAKKKALKKKTKPKAPPPVEPELEPESQDNAEVEAG